MKNNTRPIEYQITESAFKGLLSTRTEDEKQMNPYVYVMELINREYDLRGTVRQIVISGA